jgi:hypothetical protein
MTNVFELSETEGSILLEEGPGVYRVKINMKIVVGDEKRVQIADQKILVKKENSNPRIVPYGFHLTLLDYNKNLSENTAKKLFDAIKDAGADGITKRELMRVCGPSVKSDFLDRVFDKLQHLGWVSYERVRPNGKGRPKNVWILQDHS